MDKVLTRQDWSCKGWSGRVPIQCLHHPQAPVAPGAGVGAVRRIRGDAGRAVPSDIYTSIVSSYGPGKYVVMEGAHGRTRCLNLNWSGPGVALIGGKRVLEHGVADHLTAVIDRCLLPHGVEIASFVNRHRREIRAGLVRRAKVRHRQINAIQAAWIAYVGNWWTKRHREAATDQNPVQERIIMDDEDMLNRCR